MTNRFNQSDPAEYPEIPRDELEWLIDGGEQAFAEYFMSNRGRLRRMVELRLDRRLVQRVDASDVLQEGFLDASNRLDEYLAKPTMPFFVWLRFLVGQRLLAVHRWHFERQKRDPRREDVARCHPIMETDVIANEFSGAFTSPSHAAAKADLAVQIRKLLDAMDETDREILVLRHFEELSNNETAAELGLSKAATSKRYIRALTRLKETVSETLGEGL